MIISVYGQKRDYMPTNWKNHVKLLVNHVLQGYLHTNKLRHMELTISCKKDFDLGGEAEPQDWTDRYRPNHFKITVNPDMFLNMKELMTTIAHECVHVYQYAAKKLRNGANGSVWEGKVWDYADPKHAGMDPYWETPWEVEAYGMEQALLHSFVVSMATYINTLGLNANVISLTDIENLK